MTMEVEDIDGLQFVIVNQDEFEKLKEHWEKYGGTVEDVDEGVFLFNVSQGTVWRVRVRRAN